MKASDEWLHFFKVVSSLFTTIEHFAVLELHKDQLKEELKIECYNVYHKLNAMLPLKTLKVTTNI